MKVEISNIVTKWKKEAPSALTPNAIKECRQSNDSGSNSGGTASTYSLYTESDPALCSTSFLTDASTLIDKAFFDDDIYARKLTCAAPKERHADHANGKLGTQTQTSNLQDDDQYRKHKLLYQFYTFEAQYMIQLQVSISQFKQPLASQLKQLRQKQYTSNSIHVPVQNLISIFESIQDILEQVSKFVHALAARLQIWSPTQKISDVLKMVDDGMRSSYISYVTRFPETFSILEQIQRSPCFRRYLVKYVETLNQDTHLMTLLEQPLQAVNRYSQTFTALAQRTRVDHADYEPLQQCATEMSTFALALEESIQCCQRQQRLYGLTIHIRHCPILFDQPRNYIMHGHLNMRKDRRFLVLLSDVILVAKEDYHFMCKIDLTRTALVDFSDKGCFELTVSPDPTLHMSRTMPPMTYLFNADTLEEHSTWVQKIQETLESI